MLRRSGWGRARSVLVAVAVLAGLSGSAVLVGRAVAHTGHTFSIADASISEGTATGDGVNPVTQPQYDSETKNVTLTVTLNPAPQVGETLQVDYQTSTASPSNATADDTSPLGYPGDFLTSTGTVTFDSPTETTQTFTIQIQEDRADEPDETFIVNLGFPRGSCAPDIGCNGVDSSSASISDGQATVTITDDDATPTLQVLDSGVSGYPHANEGNADNVFSMKVQRAGASNRNVGFSFSTANGTATAGSDYSPTSGTGTVPNSNAQYTWGSVNVTILTDNIPEGFENFLLNISNATNATISDAQGVVGIVDGDPAAMYVSDATAAEGGNLVFKVQLSSPPTAGTSAKVNYATSDGTATAPLDYQSRSGTLTFPQFEDGPFDVVVPANADALDEPSETMKLDLTRPTDDGNFDYQLITPPANRDSQGIGTITDTDVADVAHDFNGDGFGDAVFGAPGEDIGSVGNAGAFSVIYGTNKGLSTASSAPSDQVIHLNVTNIEGTAAANDKLGSALAFGDFDNDGFDDVAAGAPGKAASSGAVSVLYGSANGLSASDDQLWTQDSTGVQDTSEGGDRFGAALTAGDFDNDGFTDLAIGAPGEDVGSVVDAGSTVVLFGATGGLVATGNQLWSQESANIGDAAETSDFFGSSLASGDFDGDGFDDLLIGVPFEDLTSAADAGLGHALYGSASGLVAGDSQLWDQGQANIEENPEAGDRFASAVAAGDVNGDGFDDAIFGVPREDVGTLVDAGGVNVILGSTGVGLAAAGDQYFDQDSGQIDGTAEAGDLFGYSLAVGNFGKDAKADLAVGAPREDIGSKADAGAVSVFYGAAAGVDLVADQLWYQDSDGVAGSSEKGDLLGVAVAAADFDGDGKAELVMGAPREDLRRGQANAGAANVLYGATAGLTANDDQIWHQDVAGVAGGAEKGDVFSQAVV